MTLQEIGLKYDTDKSRNGHKGITYLQLYDNYLSYRKTQQLNILEIGVLNGASLKTWKEYLPFSKIVGIDIDPICKRYEEDRIEIFIGSQDNEEIKNTIQSKYNTFDFILDDGSHVNVLTLKSFELYWPLVRNNGIYVIEDVPGCWTDLRKYNVRSIWPGMKYNVNDLDLNNEKNNINDFIINKIYHLMIDDVIDTYCISFRKGSMIFEKNET